MGWAGVAGAGGWRWDPEGAARYVQGGRWLAHLVVGGFGAVVNVEVLPVWANLGLLAVAGYLCVTDVLTHDVAMAVVLAKTMGGDFFAGKLDTLEWKAVLGFTFCAFGPLAVLKDSALVTGMAGTAESGAGEVLRTYGRLFPIVWLIQLVCEWGDGAWERFVFFRHRYSFEAFNLALLLLLPRMTSAERTVVQVDLVVCLGYRLSNTVLIGLKGIAPVVGDMVKKGAFRAFSALRGIRLVNVSDPEVAMAVLRASDCKGDALERNVATPAWAPVLSLESIDGPLYETMVKNFHLMYARAMDPPSKMAGIAREQAAALRKSGAEVNADAVARLTLSCFIKYLFDRDWEPRFEVLVNASWEWRMQIAVRGRANAQVKQRAIDLVVNDLLRNCDRLWNVFGDRWEMPQYWSLVMQPILLSPAINAGDIAVALKLLPGRSLDEAMRAMHPFPILERWVDRDIVHPRTGKVAVRKDSQVIMFTSDFRGSTFPWAVFGVGPRQCAGTQLATAFLRALKEELAEHADAVDRFLPEKGHRYSGRNNDGVSSVAEALYFFMTVLPVIFRTATAPADSLQPGAANMAAPVPAPAEKREIYANATSPQVKRPLDMAARPVEA